ncbi:MAG: hypothetical protein Q8R92_20290 [Deltaproteobacteria bacterium]|nr:hypothetical protein [Deltaproteobacteria bacterium]
MRKFQRITKIALATLAALILTTSPALAGKKNDGPVQIGQDLQKNKKTSESLFPIVILEPGAYVLVTNLDLTIDPLATADTDAIQIAADNVSLNMNGFSIIGPGSCTGSPVDDCDPSGEVEGGSGVDACAGEGCVKNTTVVDGTIRGMPGHGLRLGDAARVERIRAEENGEGGIGVGGNSAVTYCQAIRNDDFGIAGGDSSRLTHNTASGNGGPGTSAGEQCFVAGNVLTGNIIGLFIADNSGYLENIVTDNNTNVSSQGVGDPDQLGKNLCGNDTGCP